MIASVPALAIFLYSSYVNILIYNWKDIRNPEAGGAEVIASQFARRLARDGHEVTLFARAFRGCKGEERVDGLRVLRRGNALSVYLHAFLHYSRLPQKPDLVLDMVNTICWQTPWYVPAENRVAYVNQLAREVCFFQLPWPLSLLAYAAERLEYIPYRRTRFLCYSLSTRDDLVRIGIPKALIRVFPLGLDHDTYRLGTTKSATPLFVFVARLVNMKRADLCVRALRLVVERFPASRLVLIGGGPEERSLERLIKVLHLETHVEFLHRTANFLTDRSQQEQKVACMQDAWALLLPSVKEGWGMVVTEAAACGTPSIVTDVSGLRDSVRDDETGILVSATPSPDELAEAMCRIIADQDLRERLSANAHTWSATFDWETSYRRFREALQLDASLRETKLAPARTFADISPTADQAERNGRSAERVSAHFQSAQPHGEPGQSADGPRHGEERGTQWEERRG